MKASAVSIEGSQADQGRDFPPVEKSQFRELGQQRIDGDLADTDHGFHDVRFAFPLVVGFDEDQDRTRKRRIADNLAWLRRFSISLLKRHPSKHSIKGKSEIAGWNNEFLTQVLMGQGV